MHYQPIPTFLQDISYPIQNKDGTVTYPLGNEYYRVVAKLFARMCSYIGLDHTFYTVENLYDCCKNSDGISFRIGQTMFELPKPLQSARIYRNTGMYWEEDQSYIEVRHD